MEDQMIPFTEAGLMGWGHLSPCLRFRTQFHFRDVLSRISSDSALSWLTVLQKAPVRNFYSYVHSPVGMLGSQDQCFHGEMTEKGTHKKNMTMGGQRGIQGEPPACLSSSPPFLLRLEVSEWVKAFAYDFCTTKWNVIHPTTLCLLLGLRSLVQETWAHWFPREIRAPMQSRAPSVFSKVTYAERKRWFSLVSWSKYWRNPRRSPFMKRWQGMTV